jgi:hypothetical protein
VTDGLGLPLDVGEERRIGVAPQTLLDQGAEDDLQAHRELERGRGLPRQDPGSIQDLLGQDEQDSRLVREHHTSVSARPRLRRLFSPTAWIFVYIMIFHIYYVKL